MIREYYVSSLGEYYEKISQIAEQERNKSGSHGKKREPRLWFRGLKVRKYDMLPTLYREGYQKSNAELTYSDINRREDYRYQHFKARTYHAVETSPELRSEWQEIYQHNLGKTRMMDWSESAKIALSFSIEPFLKTKEDKNLEHERKTITPCVWVLNPYRLNEIVYKSMGELEKEYYEKALQDIDLASQALDINTISKRVWGQAL